MKLPLALGAALALLTASLHAAPPAPPQVPIDQALKLALDHLTERGLAAEHYIGSLTLEESTLSGGERYWYARWIPSIKLPDKSESGLRINMDGSLQRLVSGGPNGTGRADNVGKRPVGARNIR
jgi:hypothetical protein